MNKHSKHHESIGQHKPINLKITHLTKQYGSLVVIDNLSMDFSYNQIYCLFGPSGSGKTTLLHTLIGALSIDSGSISGFQELKVAAVFQEERLLPWATVEENLAIVLETQLDRQTINEKIDYYLDLVNLLDVKHSYPKQLSGGMRQRVSIARALVYEGDLLVLDEPFKGLDIAVKTKIMDFIKQEYKKDGKVCILVTHDKEEANYLADTIFTFEGPPLKIIEEINNKN